MVGRPDMGMSRANRSVREFCVSQLRKVLARHDRNRAGVEQERVPVRRTLCHPSRSIGEALRTLRECEAIRHL
jgi:hypothetical protein